MTPFKPQATPERTHVPEKVEGRARARAAQWYGNHDFAGSQDARHDAFVIAAKDHYLVFGATLAQKTHDDSPVRSYVDDKYRMALAHKKAWEVACALGASLDDLLVLRSQRKGEARFGIQLQGRRYFGKAKLDKQQGAWAERDWTLEASERGLALPTLTIPQMPEVFLTEWVPEGGLEVDAKLSASERAQLMARIREIHLWAGERPGPSPPRHVGSSGEHLERLEQQGAEGPLLLSDLRARLDWLNEQMVAAQPQETIVHGDMALTNVVRRDDKFYFVDWEHAGWSDPFSDLARLVSFSRWHAVDLTQLLTDYLGGSPSFEQGRHFAVMLAAFDIDHYGNQRSQRPADHVFVARWASPIADGIVTLPDMPIVRTASPKRR